MDTQKLGRSKQAKLEKLLKEFDVPNPGDTKHLMIGKKMILFVRVDYDQDAPNPCEDQDGLGNIRSFSRRHINHIDPDEAREMMEADADIVPLSYFEHGNCLWMATTVPAGVEFQWDGVRFAGIWIPDDCVRESYTGQDGKTRAAWMADQAESCCKEYSAWANGEVYGYNIELHKARYSDDGELFDDLSDYRHEQEIYEDSCWGFIGSDYFNEEVNRQVRYALEAAFEPAQASA